MTLKEVLSTKQKATRIDSLPQEARKVLNNYKNLNLNGKKVMVPYYINRADTIPFRPGQRYKVKRSLKRELVAKGNPEEIKTVVKKYAEKYNFSLEKSSIEEIQDFMCDHGIGIDCSGLVVWVLNEITKLKYHKSFWKSIRIPSGNLLKKFIFSLRPVENISVKVLKNNSKKISNLQDTRAGDVLITHPQAAYNHVILITEVGFDKNNNLLYIDYAQATDWYSARDGIVSGIIMIKNQNKYLIDQEWYEENVKKNHTLTGIQNDPKDANIMRIKYV